MKFARTLSALLMLLVWSCDQDPFHMRQRQVLPGYDFEEWEDSRTYYLVRSGDKDDGGGVLKGTVVRVGWNARYIVAERKANFGGDKNGWMIVDPKFDASPS